MNHSVLLQLSLFSLTLFKYLFETCIWWQSNKSYWVWVFLPCGAFYFAKNHFMSSKIFPVLVSFSFYIEQVHSKPRDCIFLKLGNNTALRKCCKTSSPVFALCYKNSFTSIVWTLLRCKLEFIQPSFTALLFAWFIGCMISDKLMVTYWMNEWCECKPY